MKKTMLILLVAIAFVACKKTNDLPAPPTVTPTIPTLTKKGTDKTVTPPKQKMELTYTVKGGTTDASSVSFAFDWEGTASTFALTNFTIEVTRDADSASLFRTNFPLQRDGIIPILPVIKAGVLYTVHIFFDVAATTSGTFILKMNLLSGTDGQTGFVKSAVTTFGTDAISFIPDPDTPDSTQLVLGGSEVRMQTLKVFTQGSPTITSFSIPVTNTSAVQTIAVYDSVGNNLGSTTTFSGGVAMVTTNVAQPSGWARYVIKAQLKPVTTAAQSNVAVATSVSAISFKTADGTLKVSTGSATGNDMYVMKTIVSVTSTVPTGTVTNNVPMVINKTVITSTNSLAKQKGLSYMVTLIDNGPDLDTLKAINAVMKVNGTVLNPNLYNITYASGVRTDSLTASGQIYVSFVNEITDLAAGTTYELMVTPKGYNHQNGNVLAATLMMNDARTTNRFVGTGGAVAPNNTLVKLTPSQGNAVPGVTANFTYSDGADPAHSGAMGSSTGDFTNSYLIPTTNVAQQVYTYRH